MKYSQSPLLLSFTVVVTLAGWGCSDDNQTSPPASQRVEDQTRQVIRETSRYTYDHRAEYERKLRDALDKLNRRIGVLEQKAQTADADARQEYRRQLPELRRLHDQAQTQLRRIERATPGAWDDIKQGIGSAMEDLRSAVDRAGRHFRR